MRTFAAGTPKLDSPHKGLLLDRFIAPKEAHSKTNYRGDLLAVTSYSSQSPLYRKAFTRWEETVREKGLCTVRASVMNRLALGLGNESVLENGCRLHRTYGVPVIPGSSVKGALRAGLLDIDDYRQYETGLFGTPDRAGAVEVFDAWWDPEKSTGSGLALDVVTVHHQDYYSGKDAPKESESPVPVHFLTIKGTFLFAFRVDGDVSWSDFVRELAFYVFDRKGLGAKKSSGYGRFRREGKKV